MNAIGKVSKMVDKVSRYVMIFFFIIAFLATVYQVFSRYIINSKMLLSTFPNLDLSILNFPWIEELIRYLFIWIVFLGIGIVYREKGHAHVELLLNYLPNKWKNRLIFIVECINIFFFVVLAYLSGKILKIISLQVSPSLNINMSMMYVSILVCSVICFIHSIDHLTQSHARLKTRDLPSDEESSLENFIL
ncbi:TRAP transporter small permease [Geobacillus thermodenitrificans]|uniref:TRAP transporter small permease n=1 Tax=Geobacillus thermodenitrificans TaxID=33940 RepID=UPI002E1D6F0C|nr:TRAP transporter small permease [Geobacillus thermodenitrificans]